MSTAKKILVIEDEPSCQVLLTQALASKYKLELASTISRAKDLLLKEKPDLILLDFYLPDGNAFDLIDYVKTIDSVVNIPIILLTQESNVQIKVRSFSEGVYDFVTKPFESAELLARIDSHLARAEELNVIFLKAQQVGDLVLDSEAKSVSFQQGQQLNPLTLSPIEFKILQCLMMNANKVRTREQLAVAAWNRKFFQSRTIDRHISSLRKKLGPYSDYLQTVSQGGYRLSELHTDSHTNNKNVISNKVGL